MREGDLMVADSDGSGVTTLIKGIYTYDSETTWDEDYEDPETEEEVDFVKIETFEETWDEVNDPAFSADGTRLVGEHESGSDVWGEVCAVAAYEDQSCIPFGEPGYYVDYFGECDCQDKLIVVDSSTGATLGDPLASAAVEEAWDPVYSADGKLAFNGWTDSDGEATYVVPTPGAPPQRLFADPESEIDFSPDGTRLVVVAPSQTELLVIDAANGDTITKIAAPPGPEAASDMSLDDPVFSPDGSRIAFSYDAEFPHAVDQERLFTIGLDGSGLTTLLDDGDPDPAWQPLPRLSPSPGPSPASVPVPGPAPVQPIKLIGSPAKKGKVKLDKKGRAAIGTIACGSTACRLKLVSAKLRIAKKTYNVAAPLPKSLGPNGKKKVKVKVKGKALAALKQAGVGKVTVKVAVTDAVGKKTLTLRSTLAPPAQPKGKKGKGKGRKGKGKAKQG